MTGLFSKTLLARQPRGEEAPPAQADTSQEPEVSQIVGGLGGVQTSGDRDDEEQTPDSTPLDTVT